MKKYDPAYLIRENWKLKIKLEQAKELNKSLNVELELAWGNCLLKYYDFLEVAQQQYGPMVSPSPVQLSGQYTCTFGKDDYDKHQVNVRNVVAIVSNRKYKRLYFKEPIYSKEIIGPILSSLRLDINFDELQQALDRPRIRLFKISKSIHINIEHFRLRSKYLECVEVDPLKLPEALFEYKLGKVACDEIRRMQNHLIYMLSFRKINVRSEFGIVHPNE